jgi:hypothetical protein
VRHKHIKEYDEKSPPHQIYRQLVFVFYEIPGDPPDEQSNQQGSQTELKRTDKAQAIHRLEHIRKPDCFFDIMNSFGNCEYPDQFVVFYGV